MDMARTFTNVFGNCLASVVMAKLEGEFRKDGWEKNLASDGDDESEASAAKDDVKALRRPKKPSKKAAKKVVDDAQPANAAPVTENGAAPPGNDVPVREDAAKTTMKTPAKEEAAIWCDASVAKMYELRYKTELKKKFESKNNFQKNLAAVTLADRLSSEMHRTFSANQVTTKFARMRTKWSASKRHPPPAEALDDPIEFSDENENESTSKSIVVDEHDRPNIAKKRSHTIVTTTSDDMERRTKRTKTTGDAIENGLLAVGKGLVSLGESLAASRGSFAQSNATLDDVLEATKAQETSKLAAQMEAIVSALKSQTDTMAQLIAAIANRKSSNE
ncbi:hypothetical protein SDRG_15587 [Saprolegnia diclina VS20]|uniref:Amino acid transporter n=1 Tax=Saprolegnia diclina (strain VS20) TaxID=1156394 RepID=T0PML0_SAPDV|nr:hypothetical protein SDRG_15587 [Saprolegnia diclina VS20]EQC26649.1 hypothetical protein SDRG_15587 [Saprolegnia diclina VS20]|eukprot:XP_008619987.1 hypothetical protein SDRG_15587 [Saprolegnia diclina VS20]